MAIVMIPLIKVMLAILGVYTWMLIAYAIMSWLMVFGIINARSPIVFAIGNFLQKLIEPVLRPLRRIIPVIGGIDLSMLGLFFLIYFVEQILYRIMISLA